MRQHPGLEPPGSGLKGRDKAGTRWLEMELFLERVGGEELEGAQVGVGRASSSHHRRGSRSMYSGPWLHTEQKNR